jgi:hypothetical protein
MSRICPGTIRSLLLFFALHALTAFSQSPKPSSAPADWLTGDGVSLGGIIFPHFHFTSTYGGSTGEPQALRVAGEDPQRNGWSIQGLEFAVSARITPWLEGFGNLHLSYNSADRKWEHEFEEWFGKIKDIPGGFELRGGRYLNRFGFENSIHNHGWDYVNQELVNGRFLGSDGLATLGGEVTWTVPVSWTSLISVSAGEPPTAPGRTAGLSPKIAFDPARAAFRDTFAVANWTNNADYNDFHQFRFGLSAAWGTNDFDRATRIYGTHLEYQWRKNGYEAGGDYFRWRSEAMIRTFGAVSDPLPVRTAVRAGDLHEFGTYSAFAYGLDCGVEFGLRGDFVSGIAAAGLDRRFRVSPSVTCFINRNRTFYVRAEYDYDHGGAFGNEHSIWLQLGLNWGGREVR